SIAGPKILEHLVDTVLYFEGERFHSFRILRVVKNRFGAISEIGVFEMSDRGLSEIKNPSEVFISKNNTEPGQAICVTIEGTRPLLAEAQTLITKTAFGYPKRTASGYDLNRLNILIAVMTRALHLPLSTLDVYSSIAGGLKIKEPACDLAICVSIMSSYLKKRVHPKIALFGEVSLLGEVRPVSKAKDRIHEAEKLGFDHVIVPKGTGLKSSKLQIIEVSDIKEAVKKAIEA
ncbi:DNA repair protein RadA, partial [bacterium]|nr:DNA repair protein RadA [bacterium]